MTKLQNMAVSQIHKLAHGMRIELRQHTPIKLGVEPTENELKQKDTASQEIWHLNNRAQEEIKDWASALLKERDNS